jgi:putative transposase
MGPAPSVKTSEMGGPAGYDGNKKVKGRKRHIVVDTLGLLLAVVVTAANLDDGTYTPWVLAKLRREKFPRLEVVFGDNKYNNRTRLSASRSAGAPRAWRASSR